MNYIFWRVAFEDGTTGYQVMTPDLVSIGVYDDSGTLIADPVVYTTTDSGSEAHIGLPAPAWAALLGPL